MVALLVDPELSFPSCVVSNLPGVLCFTLGLSRRHLHMFPSGIAMLTAQTVSGLLVLMILG